jgi:hypothetical protein
MLATGTYAATVTISSTTAGVLSYSLTVVLVIPSTSPCAIITSPNLPPLTVGTVAEVIMTYTGTCPANYKWTVTAPPDSLPAGLAFNPINVDDIFGTPTGPASPYNAFVVKMINTTTSGVAASLAFNGGTVAAENGCQIGPVPEPTGTATVFYAQGFETSATCTSPSDNAAGWMMGITAGIPPGLKITANSGVKGLSFYGTPTQAGTFNFTVTFTNTQGGAVVASATQPYTMIIDQAPPAAPGAARGRAAATRGGTR